MADYDRYGYDVYFGVGPNVSSLTDYAQIVDYAEHPSYNTSNLRNDIGVAQLAGSGITSVDPVPLNTDALDGSWVGMDLRYVGYGITNDGRSDPARSGWGTSPSTNTTATSSSPTTAWSTSAPGTGGAGLYIDGSDYYLVAVNSYVTPAATAVRRAASRSTSTCPGSGLRQHRQLQRGGSTGGDDGSGSTGGDSGGSSGGGSGDSGGSSGESAGAPGATWQRWRLGQRRRHGGHGMTPRTPARPSTWRRRDDGGRGAAPPAPSRRRVGWRCSPVSSGWPSPGLSDRLLEWDRTSRAVGLRRPPGGRASPSGSGTGAGPRVCPDGRLAVRCGGAPRPPTRAVTRALRGRIPRVIASLDQYLRQP